MGMVQALGTGMDRTEFRQGGQSIDDQLMVKGWELLDKWTRKWWMLTAPHQISMAQATEQSCCLRPADRGCWGGPAPGTGAEAAPLGWIMLVPVP